MTTKAIRGVSDEEWAGIKAIANRRGMPIGKFIVKAAKEAEKIDNKRAWDSILSEKPDPNLAREIEKAVKEFRKGFRLREFR